MKEESGEFFFFFGIETRSWGISSPTCALVSCLEYGKFTHHFGITSIRVVILGLLLELGCGVSLSDDDGQTKFTRPF